MVVTNGDGSETIKRTFIINSHNAILVDSTRVTEYEKYFMASVREQKGKFIVSIPNSAYDLENGMRFMYVASNGSYRHVMDGESKVEIPFKNYDLATIGQYFDVEVPLTAAQYTGLKYSAAFGTNYILCYTVEIEEITTEPVIPELPPVEDGTENDTPVVEPEDTQKPELDEPGNKPVAIKKDSGNKISTTDMFKLFIVGAAVILFFKIVNYRKSVKMI